MDTAWEVSNWVSDKEAVASRSNSATFSDWRCPMREMVGVMARGDDFVFSRGDLLHKSSTDASSAACNKPNLGGYVDGD